MNDYPNTRKEEGKRECVIVDTIRGHRRDNSTTRRIAMENRSMNDID